MGHIDLHSDEIDRITINAFKKGRWLPYLVWFLNLSVLAMFSTVAYGGKLSAFTIIYDYCILSLNFFLLGGMWRSDGIEKREAAAAEWRRNLRRNMRSGDDE